MQLLNEIPYQYELRHYYRAQLARPGGLERYTLSARRRDCRYRPTGPARLFSIYISIDHILPGHALYKPVLSRSQLG